METHYGFLPNSGALWFEDIQARFRESNEVLEVNYTVLNYAKFFDALLHKRRRLFVKEIK